VSDIPIIGAPPKELTYPNATMQFMQNGSGAMLVVQLGPVTSINHFFDAASMDGIVAQWRDVKKQTALIMRAVQNSRNV
jgi:hypothetical protein